jgi:hypothetical protein
MSRRKRREKPAFEVGGEREVAKCVMDRAAEVARFI